jgi:hypothetical protein
MGSKDLGQIPVLNPPMVVGTKHHSPQSSTSYANSDPSLLYGTSRRLERGHSNGGKLRPGGLSAHKTLESRTVGEFALHHLFTAVSICLVGMWPVIMANENVSGQTSPIKRLHSAQTASSPKCALSKYVDRESIPRWTN